jgi:hypothetical protein
MKGRLFMAVEYSFIATQSVDVDENVLFLNGNRCCKKGLIMHNDSSGVFRVKGVSNCCKTIYKVHFNANIAIATGGTVEPISVSLTYNGEVLRNTTAIVTPAAIGDFFNVSFETFIDIDCGCCVSIAVENTSATTPIDVQNANIIIDRVA